MPFSWHEIHEHLMQSSFTLGFQREFDAIRQDYQHLEHFSDPAAVLDVLHHGPRDHEAKNRILTSLIMTAQSQNRNADCALTMMLLALWPGMDAILRRSRRRNVGHVDELPSEILARATEAVRCLDPGRVNWIAATILRNVERDIMRAHQRDANRQAQHADIDTDEVAADGFTDSPPSNPNRLFDEVRYVIGADARLVIRVAIEGFSQVEMAVELGLSEAATRKRYQRAIRKLRNAMKENS